MAQNRIYDWFSERRKQLSSFSKFRAVPPVALVLIALSGCASPSAGRAPEIYVGPQYFHERLSLLLIRSGFPHKIFSERTDHLYVDSIHVALSPDTIIRKHESLERLLSDVGRLCADPEYSNVVIRVVVTTILEADSVYVRDVLSPWIASRKNVSLTATKGPVDGFVVVTRQVK